MSAAMNSGYKLTNFGMIPSDWDVGSIADGVDLLTGFPFASKGYASKGTRLLRGSNVKRGKTDWDEEITQYWPEITPALIKYELKVGDLVVAMDGSLVGRSYARLGESDLPALLLQRVARLRSTNHLDAGFLSHFIGSRWFIGYVDSVKTVTAIPHISPADIRGFSIPIPPNIEEQRRISSALSDMDALISGLDQLIAKKRDIKQATMQQLLTGQTRLPGFCGDWRCVRAGEIGRFRGGNGFPIKYQGESASDYPFYKVSDMNNEGNEIFMSGANNWISEVSRKSIGATVFPEGSIIFAKVGAAVFLERKKILKWPSCIDNNLAALEIDKSVADVRFIHYALLNVKFGSLVSTTALPSLNGATLSQITVPLPGIAEQREISSVLAEIDAELDLLEGRLAKSHALKKGMMQELLTGRIRLV